MARKSEAKPEYVLRGLKYQHLGWSAEPPGFVVLPAALILRKLIDPHTRQERLETGLSVYYPSARLDTLLQGRKPLFKALARIDVEVLLEEGYTIETKAHDPNAADVVGLPPATDPQRSREAALRLLPALSIVRPPDADVLRRLREDWKQDP
jgi:hypothetical protein